MLQFVPQPAGLSDTCRRPRPFVESGKVDAWTANSATPSSNALEQVRLYLQLHAETLEDVSLDTPGKA